jgi:putative ABC transport system permease protein
MIAQRRLRQLGVLGALGATERHLRFMVVVNGAAVGVAASFIGCTVGAAAWFAFAGLMEEPVGHRIDRGNVPWWAIGVDIALTVGAATLAAWWPARVVARVPVVRALSGRPARARPVRQSAMTAGLLLGVGLTCLALSVNSFYLMLATGTVATVAGVLLLAPLTLRVAARGIGGFPVAMRLALRDLVRHQARSAVALAAVSLTLGVPAAIVVASSAAEASRPPGNLPPEQLVVWTRDSSQPEGVSPYYTEDPDDDGFSPYLPRLTAAEIEDMATAARRISDRLDDAEVTPLQLVTDTNTEPTADGRLAVTLALSASDMSFDVAPLFVASPELLDDYGVDEAALDADSILTVPDLAARLPGEIRRELVSDEIYFANTGQPVEPVGPVRRLSPGYSSLPASLITPSAARDRGWEPVTVGWLLQAAAPLSAEQIGQAREIAAGAGMLVEPPREEPTLVSLRWYATAAGLVLALGVLAATVGLLRHETQNDLRTLTAAGASRRIRRTLSATTCGGLALLGSTIGVAGTYLALIAVNHAQLDRLLPIPIIHLLVLTLGVPAFAALVAWLMSGREPRTLASVARFT